MKYHPITRKWSNALLLLFLGLLSTTTIAQDIDELKEQRAKLLQEIKINSVELKQTQENKATVLDQYVALNRQIRKRQSLIRTLQKEIEYINENIEQTTLVIEALNVDLDTLKTEYAKMLQAAYRQHMTKSRLFFLFSAKSFNEASQRWRYLKQYDEYRQKQVRLITETKVMLESKIRQLNTDRNSKEQLYQQQRTQRDLVASELRSKDDLLGRLKSNEAQLVAQIEGKERQSRNLAQEIDRIISEEIAKRNKSETSITADEISIASAGFKGMSGKLPWPVSNGKIVSTFGLHSHPNYPNVKTMNNGIDIEANSNAVVKAVYPGIVTYNRFIGNSKNVVLVSHGNYYTVYSNLDQVFVNRNQRVKAGDVIGKLGTTDRVLHFEVWKQKKQVDPAQWIRKY